MRIGWTPSELSVYVYFYQLLSAITLSYRLLLLSGLRLFTARTVDPPSSGLLISCQQTPARPYAGPRPRPGSKRRRSRRTGDTAERFLYPALLRQVALDQRSAEGKFVLAELLLGL
jgi:hypothetical protein